MAILSKKSVFFTVRRCVNRLGFNVVRVTPPSEFPPDFDADTIETIKYVQAYTMTSPERVFALCEATRYVARHRIPGAFVECGVWRGGSMMAVARTLIQEGDTARELFLFDTYEGLPEPDSVDVTADGVTGAKLLETAAALHDDTMRCYAGLEDVRQAMATTHYPTSQIHYVKGLVEETLPENAPGTIALLRLDTDFYQSTRHELIHLFPLVSNGGVVIIDDYGYWEGARKAVDEYLRESGARLLLNRIDGAGRTGVVVRGG